MLLTLITAALVAPALVAAQTPPYKSPFYFTNPTQLDGKKCVTPDGGSAVVGAKLVISDCVSSAAQKISWVGSSVRSGTLCWTAKSGNNTVSLATCNSADNSQSWYFNKFGGRAIKHNPTGLCLNLASAITTNGNPIQLLACEKGIGKQIWNPSYPLGELPAKVFVDSNTQTGTNQCGTTSSQSSKCQNLIINDINDWCLFAPPTVGAVGDMEPNVVAYCLRSGRGTRTIPDGSLKGVHFIKTSSYVQINAVGDFTKVNIPKGDSGGELDPHGATAAGNPVGGLVYGNVHGSNVQYHEWSSFISDREFCIRACLGPTAQKDCPHIYDVMGCYWNQPGNYNSGVFESCNGDKTLPAGIYGTSTWSQGVSPTPAAHPAAPSSQCAFQSTVKVQPLGGTTTTTSNQPTGTPGTGKVIRSKANTNKCIAAASNVRGAAIVIQDCTGAANQLFNRVGNEYRVYGFCIDIVGGVNATGTRLQTYSCGGTNVNQQFTNPASDSAHIGWIGRGKAIDMTGGNFANGTPLQIWTWSNTTANLNQHWTY